MEGGLLTRIKNHLDRISKPLTALYYFMFINTIHSYINKFARFCNTIFLFIYVRISNTFLRMIGERAPKFYY